MNKFAPLAEARAVAVAAVRIPGALVPVRESVDKVTADEARGTNTGYLSSPEKETGKLRDLKNKHLTFSWISRESYLG